MDHHQRLELRSLELQSLERLQFERRTAIKGLSTLALATLPFRQVAYAQEPGPGTGMGLVVYNCRFRRDWLLQQNPAFDLFEPLQFLKHCKGLGATGMQAQFGVMDAEKSKRLREYAEQHSLFIEAIAAPPVDRSDVSRFEAEIKTAVDVGALAVRMVIMPGRRYEQFSSLGEFQEYERRGRRMVELAAPVAERHHLPLAIENHKDQRNDERIALLEQIDSEFVGVCLDTGNSLALLEDPIETVEAFAPWAKSVHLKDQAVQEYPDGFLLADIPLGQGCFDLPKMVQILAQANPKIRFVLELITRDPLKVTCLSDSYWATMPHVSGRDLARTLRFVREGRAETLQQVSTLSSNERLRLEDENIGASLLFARNVLKL